MLVYLPQDKHIGISQRIERESEREALREKLGRVWYPATKRAASSCARWPRARPRPNWPRTSSTCASSGATSRPVDHRRTARAALPGAVAGAARAARLRQSRDRRIVIDSRENFQRLTAFAAEYTPTVAPLLEHYTGERPLFDLHGVEDEIQKALARRVDLKSGGYLIIDQTEAMTTIDVNTGGFVGVRNFDDTIFKTNLEAAQTIARQLRLRNLGGIIIIDFIDMENEEHRTAVLSEFNKALARDHTRLTVNGFTALGLVEMTRKRTRESLAHVLCEECPTCGGRGEVRTARTVCYEILRELLREARQFNAREYPRARQPGGDRPLPRRGVAGSGDALRFHRQADFAAGRAQLLAGAVRHRSDVSRGATSSASRTGSVR
jgi:ribonuclease G